MEPKTTCRTSRASAARDLGALRHGRALYPGEVLLDVESWRTRLDVATRLARSRARDPEFRPALQALGFDALTGRIVLGVALLVARLDQRGPVRLGGERRRPRDRPPGVSADVSCPPPARSLVCAERAIYFDFAQFKMPFPLGFLGRLRSTQEGSRTRPSEAARALGSGLLTPVGKGAGPPSTSWPASGSPTPSTTSSCPPSCSAGGGGPGAAAPLGSPAPWGRADQVRRLGHRAAPGRVLEGPSGSNPSRKRMRACACARAPP